MPKFSIIIPLFNRPAEIDELLKSLTLQTEKDFEVIVVEDGSTISAKSVVEGYAERLTIKYLTKDNSGPALARNFGSKEANGEWLIFLDSDCVVPPQYLENVTSAELTSDFWGGPDKAEDSYSATQKAINYSMTSFFTTGGIRGGEVSLEKFHPRSFNMGIRRDAFDAVGGFAAMRFGEDVDLSMRLFEAGYKCNLIKEAWVYHKRRVDWRKFYRQVRASGGARVALTKKHKGSLKLVHLLPAAFLVFFVVSIVGAIFCPYAIIPLGIYLVVIGVDCSMKTKNIGVGALAVIASTIQLCGYGTGFVRALFGANLDKIKNKKFYK